MTNGAGAEIAAMDYDFARRRTDRVAAGVSLHSVYGAEQVIEERGSAGQVVNRYDYGADLVRMDLGGEGERWAFADGQGSVTALGEVAGATVRAATRTEYDAWGTEMARTAPSGNAVGYTGQRLDAETGLMPLGSGERYYSPGIGRFLQQDRLAGDQSMPQSLNRFAYVNGNPLMYTDPSGNEGVVWDGWVNQAADPKLPDWLNKLEYGRRYVTYQAVNAYTLGWAGTQDVTVQQYQNGEISGLDLAGLTVANTGIAAVKAAAVVASIVYLPVLATGLAAYGLSTAAVATITTAVGVADGVAQLALSDGLNMTFGFQKDWSPPGAYYLAGALGGLGGFGAGVGAARAGIAVEQAESIGARQVALTARPVGKTAGGMRGAAPKGASRAQLSGDFRSGAGGNWRTIGEAADPATVKQANNYACGQACGEMVLKSQGVRGVTQRTIAETSGEMIESVESLTRALNELDPVAAAGKGRWVGGDLRPTAIADASEREVFESLIQQGPFVAEMREPGARIGHFVTVDGLTSSNRIRIRDPWNGTKYQMTWREFEKYYTRRSVVWWGPPRS